MAGEFREVGMADRLTPGEIAPDFELPTADGTTVSLRQFRGKNVVVYFYPAAMTPGCTTQACAFRDSLAALRSAGYAVIGISSDPITKLAKFAEVEDLNFPLASDPSRETITAWGAYGERNIYGKKVKGVIRSTVVVDPDGKVSVAQYNVRATGHVAKLRRDLGIDTKPPSN